MPKAELIGLEAPETAHGSLVFALAQGPRQIQSCGQEVTLFKRQSGPDPDSDGQASCLPMIMFLNGQDASWPHRSEPDWRKMAVLQGKFGKASPCRLDCTRDERLAQSARGDGGSSCRA
jgi:hypothetical protein